MTTATMTRDDFIRSIGRMIQLYIDNADRFDSNPQLRVNPATLDASVVNGSDMLAELENSNENVENEAGAEGAEAQDDADFQAGRNPDFYAVSRLVSETADRTRPDLAAIAELAESYTGKKNMPP
ncbi:MAG: hypothetical protein K2I28_05050 [Muribaculaceae bacterium]|nr:hypothetical protein [Muribaculaceae bacterium]